MTDTNLPLTPAPVSEPLPVDALPPTPAAPPRSIGDFVWELVQTLVLAGLLIVFFRAFIFQNYIVDGSSMLPTLRPDERLIVSRLNYLIGKPERGDVIVFQFPLDPSRDFVKRIIGLPGETVAIQDGIVYIDGQPIDNENYIEHQSYTSMDPVTLGDDEYFVMGDNRAGSDDSRRWGPLPARNIIGKAWLVYFPCDKFGLVTHPALEPGA